MWIISKTNGIILIPKTKQNSTKSVKNRIKKEILSLRLYILKKRMFEKRKKNKNKTIRINNNDEKQNQQKTQMSQNPWDGREGRKY
jgi:hypothetical protein